jgi:hypothetical protein
MKNALLFLGLYSALGVAAFPQSQHKDGPNTCCKADVGGAAEMVCLTSASMKAHILRTEPLKAPCCSKNLREKGIIVVSVKVSPDGDVSAFQILEGKPLGSASLSQALPTWKFRALSEKAKAQAFCGRLVIRYSLRDGSATMGILRKLPGSGS